MLGDQSGGQSNAQPGSLKAKLKTQQREHTRILTPAIPFIGLGRDEALPTPFSQFRVPLTPTGLDTPESAIKQEEIEQSPQEAPIVESKPSKSLREIKEKRPYNQDLFTQFIQILLRCFYTDNEILVGEMLLREQKSINEKDLAKLIFLSEQQIRKTLPVLERDLIIAKDNYVTEIEKLKYNERVQMSRATGISMSRKGANASPYWRISELSVVGALYKLTQLDERLEKEFENAQHDDEFTCKDCNLNVNSFDALKLPRDPVDGTFICNQCGSKLQHGDTWSIRRETGNRLERAKQELSKLRELIARLLDTDIPRFPIIDKNELEDKVTKYSDPHIEIDAPIMETEITNHQNIQHQNFNKNNKSSQNNPGILPWVPQMGVLRPSVIQNQSLAQNFSHQNLTQQSTLQVNSLEGSLLSSLKVGSSNSLKNEIYKKEELNIKKEMPSNYNLNTHPNINTTINASNFNTSNFNTTNVGQGLKRDAPTQQQVKQEFSSQQNNNTSNIQNSNPPVKKFKMTISIKQKD